MRRSIVVFLAVLAVALSACRSSTVETTMAPPETTTTRGEATPATTSPAPISTTTSPTAAPTPFPAGVETDLGMVVVEERPERIVSLSASHTEMLYAIGAGDQVLGTDLTSNYPEEANGTSKVDSFNFNIEEIVALEPDLLILAFDFQGETEALATLGVPFLLLGPPNTLMAAFDQLVAVGAATGKQAEAAGLRDELGRTAADLIDAASALGGVRIYHEVDETLFSATSDSFIGDIYAQLNLMNIADVVPGEFPQLSPEFIIDEDPDFIFLADTGFGVTTESVANRPGWETITAVQQGNIVALDTDIAGRWGPRTVELMEQILEPILAEVG